MHKIRIKRMLTDENIRKKCSNLFLRLENINHVHRKSFNLVYKSIAT